MHSASLSERKLFNAIFASDEIIQIYRKKAPWLFLKLVASFCHHQKLTFFPPNIINHIYINIFKINQLDLIPKMSIIIALLSLIFSKSTGSELSIPGPIGFKQHTPAGVPLGSFDISSTISFGFDVEGFRGYFGNEIAFYIDNGDNVKPIELWVPMNGAYQLNLNFQDEQNYISCPIGNGKETLSIVISNNQATMSKNGVQCGAQTFTNDIVESNLMGTSFNLYYGGANDQYYWNIVIATGMIHSLHLIVFNINVIINRKIICKGWGERSI